MSFIPTRGGAVRVFAMNELVRFSARRAAAAPALFGPFPEGRASPHEIEGSWTRVEPPRQLALFPSVAGAARTALLVWGGISLAAVSGAAVVYAHGGFDDEGVAIEKAGAAPRQAVAAVAPQSAVTAVAQKPVRFIETPRASIEKPVTLAALPVPAIPSPALLPAAEIPAAQAAPAEARLPKPRPEPPLVTASIPKLPSEPVVAAPTKPVVTSSVAPPRAIYVRRPVYVGGYPVYRPRYYRYRAPVF